MRLTLILAPLALALGAGCIAHHADSYTIVADTAHIEAVDAAGEPWCPAYAELTTTVAATVAGVSSESEPAPGFTPRWDASLLDAGYLDFFDGLHLELRGRCGPGGDVFSLGELTIHPPTTRIYDGAVIIAAVGKVAKVHLHFVALTDGGGGDDVYYDDSNDYSDDSGGGDGGGDTYYYYDDGGSDGGSDNSDNGDCGCDDGSYDDSGSDNSSSDDSSSDDSGSDDSSSDSSDDGW